MLARVNWILEKANNYLGYINTASRREAKMEYSIETESKGLDWDNTFLNVANTLGNMSHCVSKKVACLITKDSRIISTGINGTPKGLINCDELFEQRNFDRTFHHEFSKKYEIHAEINALLNAARNGISIEGTTLYVNYTPCIECAKAIVASGINQIVFKEFYENDLNGFVFLYFCSLKGLVNIYQVIEEENNMEIKDKAEKDLAKLKDIGKYIDSLQPFGK